MRIKKWLYFALFILFAFVLFLNKENITHKPWLTEQPLEMTGYASGNGQMTAIIADSSKTIIVINKEGELIYRLQAAIYDFRNISRSFVSAEQVELDEENNLYVYDKIFGGAFEENTERILKYSSNGKFLGEIYSYSYENKDFITTTGKICTMVVDEDFLYLIRIEHEGFFLERINKRQTVSAQQEKPHTQIFFPYPNAFREVSHSWINL